MILSNWDMHRCVTNFAFSNLNDYLEMIESQFEVARERERTRTALDPPSCLSEDDYLEWKAEWQADIQF